MSVVVRDALESYFSEFELVRLERSLQEGALANSELDRQFCAEFEFADANAEMNAP